MGNCPILRLAGRSNLRKVSGCFQYIMIEEVFYLLLALPSVVIILLDPAIQLANGVDLYMEASYSSPLMVSCPPPRVGNGSWICSERRPLPECYLFCPSG